MNEEYCAIPVGSTSVNMFRDHDAIVIAIDKGKKWEAETRAIWPLLVDPQKTVFDVGSYTGLYAIAAAKLGANVVAMEPHPTNYLRLKKNIRINDPLGERINVMNVAASNVLGKLTLSTYADRLDDMARAESKRGPVQLATSCTPIDHLNNHGPVGLMKIDVEWWERQVVRGAMELINRDHPHLIVETLDPKMRADIEDMLPKGYVVDSILDLRNTFFRYVP